MAAPARQPDEDQKVHQVRWEADDWARILRTAEVLGDRDHLNLTATDIIRSGTLKLVEATLGPAREPAKAS